MNDYKIDILEYFRAMYFHKTGGTPVFVPGSSSDQDFAFPKTIIDYITKNPTSSNLWKKLVQTCKYFYDENSIALIPCLHTDPKSIGYYTCSANGRKDFPVGDGPHQFWITDTVDICPENDDFVADCLIPRIHKCDAQKIRLLKQDISFKDFQFLVSDIESGIFATWIFDEDDNVVPFEKILEVLPKIKDLLYFFNGQDVTSKTAQKIVELDHVKSFKKMALFKIPASFDFETFSKFMLENKHIEFYLDIDGKSATPQFKINIMGFVEKFKAKDYGETKLPTIIAPKFN